MKEEATLAELAQQFDVHPNQIAEWKHRIKESAEQIFENGLSKKCTESEIKQLHAKIGQLTMERDFLSEGLGR